MANDDPSTAEDSPVSSNLSSAVATETLLSSQPWKTLNNQSLHPLWDPPEEGDGEDNTINQLTAILTVRLESLLLYREQQAIQKKQELEECGADDSVATDDDKEVGGEGPRGGHLKLSEDDGKGRTKDDSSSGGSEAPPLTPAPKSPYNQFVSPCELDIPQLRPKAYVELREYVSRIAKAYRAVRYHALDHAAHVTFSAHKMLQMLSVDDAPGLVATDVTGLHVLTQNNVERSSGGDDLQKEVESEISGQEAAVEDEKRKDEATTAGGGFTKDGKASSDEGQGEAVADAEPTADNDVLKTTYNRSSSMPESAMTESLMSAAGGGGVEGGGKAHQRPSLIQLRSTFGISSNPLILFAFVFAALIHDVDHTGIANRQLVAEGHELALLYNDQSVAEQHSLQVAFALLGQSEFDHLRLCIIPTLEERMEFRRLVIELLMCTDLASPERMQIGKSKWKEAFSDTISAPALPVAATLPAAAPEEAYDGDGETNASVATASSSLGKADESVASAPSSRAAPIAVGGYSRRHSCPDQPRQILESSSALSGGRRSSAIDVHKVRLGIKRSINLTGEKIESLPSSGEERLKSRVVLEHMIQACDVAHTLQGWENFCAWNERLLEEHWVAHVTGRGEDPTKNWYEGQITFFDCYVIPLAKKLWTCGVFGSRGGAFLTNALDNRRRWYDVGKDMTKAMVARTMAKGVQ